jgi:hypothetical protein
MKKQLALSLLAIVSFFAFAEQDAAQAGAPEAPFKRFALGGRLIASAMLSDPALDIDSRYEYDVWGSDSQSAWSVYGSYRMSEHLSLQLEALYKGKKQMELDRDDYSDEDYHEWANDTFSYSAIELPLLLNVRFRPALFLIGAYAGPYVSIPVGKMKDEFNYGVYSTVDDETVSHQTGEEEYAIVGVTYGFCGGGQLGLQFGPNFALFADLRYCQDFVPVSAKIDGKKEAVFSQAGYQASLGVEIALW